MKIRVKPRSSFVRVGGSYGDGELIVAVREAASEGRATEGALCAIADAFGVARSAVRLCHGATARTKLLEIEGDEVSLAARLQDLLVA